MLKTENKPSFLICSDRIKETFLFNHNFNVISGFALHPRVVTTDQSIVLLDR